MTRLLFCAAITVVSILPLSAAQPIARWAFPDLVSVTGTAHVGLVAYSADGIDRIDFSTDDGSVTSVTAETKNPTTGEYEYVYAVNTTGLSNAAHTVQAVIYPTNGSSVAMDDITLDVVNGMSFNSVTVNPGGGGDYTSLDAALDAVTGGDTIYLSDGDHEGVGSWTPNFDRWVYIKPVAGQQPVISNTISLSKEFLKWEGITFDGSSQATNANLIHSTKASNNWFDGCTFRGLGKENYNNGQSAFRITTSATRNTIVENCYITGTSRAFVVGGPQSILRNNTMQDLSSDIFNPGSKILITGNKAFDTKSPKLFLEAAGSAPYNFSTNKELVINHCEANNSCDSADYNVYTIADLSSGAANPAAVTVAEAAAALNAEASFYEYCWAEERDGKLRIYSRRSNYVQQMWVTGGANTALGIPNDSYANELSGAGAHSDIFQYWGLTGTIDTVRDIIFRNNNCYDNHSQGLYSGERVHSINLAFVNNLVDGFGKGGWNVNFTGSPDAGEHFENVIFEHNTIWDMGAALYINDTENSTGMVFRNNVLGRRYMGAGDAITTTGSDMDYNCYYWYHWQAPPAGSHSIVINTSYDAPITLFNGVVLDSDTEDDSGDFTLSATSACRDVGTNASGIIYDLAWNLRDATPDMGCYEYRVPGAVALPDGEYRLSVDFRIPNPVSLTQLRMLGDGVVLQAADGRAVPASQVTEAGIYCVTYADGMVGRIVVVK